MFQQTKKKEKKKLNKSTKRKMHREKEIKFTLSSPFGLSRDLPGVP
jgi:hypothetical protein